MANRPFFKVWSLADSHFFLNSMNEKNIIDMIKEGVMVGPASQAATEIGRKYTKRQMPW